MHKRASDETGHCVWRPLRGWPLLAFALAGLVWLGAMLPGLGAGGAARAEPPAGEPITPEGKPIELFNGKDLDGWYTWLKDTHYEDPRQVFTVNDGLLRISGDGFGYVCTRQEYRDYHLVAEFKWGQQTWEPRKTNTRDSGVLLHCVGPDGNSGAWMASIEFQLIEGGVGDIIVVGGKYQDGSSVPVSLTCEVAEDRDGETIWQRGSERKTFTGGRINWFGRDPDWEDVLGFRGDEDVESPGGEWNRIEAIARGGRLTYIVNGIVVNEGFDAFPSAGKILLQTEGAELFFRKVELIPLDDE